MVYLPHAQYTITTFRKSFSETKDLPYSLLYNLGWCYHLQGKDTEAEAMNRQALQLGKRVLGKDHPDTLTSINSFAESLRQRGKYTEAETMHRQTLLLKERVLGKDHPDMLTSISNLANSLRQRGKYTEAETMNRQTL
jgi:tetratricopeptide (TPR) repeat protein